jgi:hypothetical protein
MIAPGRGLVLPGRPGQNMSTQQPIPLTPIQTGFGTPEYQAILTWPFSTQPFL